jgi:hypothetical protein
VAVGDTVTVAGNIPMVDFYSSTLKKTFDKILFSSSITVGDGEQASPTLPPGHPELVPASAAVPTDFSDLSKAEGGYTVAELYAKKDELAGQDVVVRGKVVKTNLEVMGHNWVHLQDGTGEDGSNDLTLTTDAAAPAVGDTVTARGVLGTDKDFGYSYQYDVLVENATFTSP